MSEALQSKSKVTVVVTPRDRFSLAVRTLNELVANTATLYELIYIDAGSPNNVAEQLREICKRNGFRYLRFDHFMSPCQSRNTGQRLATTPYVTFIDNDVMVSENWLEGIVRCADETGADVVQPLICQGTPLHTEIHQAGGVFTDDPEAFFNGPKEMRRLTDDHLWHQEGIVGEVELARSQIQVAELHCFLVRKDAFERYGEFDEEMPCLKDYLDFSISIVSKGGRIMMEPSSIVTFCMPCRDFPVRPADRTFFLLRWSPAWQRQSLNRFQTKWGLENDPYFDQYRILSNWRFREGIAKPLTRKMPFIGHSYKVQQMGSALMMPFLVAISAHLARQHAKATNQSMQRKFAKSDTSEARFGLTN